jgi:hypothetical protein
MASKISNTHQKINQNKNSVVSKSAHMKLYIIVHNMSLLCLYT